MTVEDMILILDEAGFEDTETERKVEVINDAIQDICSRDPWPFLEKVDPAATVDAAGLVSVADNDLGAVRKVLNSDGHSMQWIRHDSHLRSHGDRLDEQGEAWYYFFVGDNLYVYPITSGTVYVNYFRRPATVVEGSAEADIDFPARHHRVIVMAALVSLYAGEDDPEQASMFKSRLDERLITIRQDLFRKQYDSPDSFLILDADDWDLE